MNIQPVFLASDILFYLLLAMLAGFGCWASRQRNFRESWRQVVLNPLALVSLVVLLTYLAVGLLDSIHFQQKVTTASNGKTYYSAQVKSLLDVALGGLGDHSEKTYSAPFALHLYAKELARNDTGTMEQIYPRLHSINPSVKTAQDRRQDVFGRIAVSVIEGIVLTLILSLIFSLYLRRQSALTFSKQWRQLLMGRARKPWGLLLVTLGVIIFVILLIAHLSGQYHMFGTDKVGNDVLYQALKSIRTGLLIGSLTTLVMLPFALILGAMAGYFGGIVDDIIQYVYTTLSSIPGVLLIAAAILSIQIYIANHPEAFTTIAGRADARLIALCIILGVTSWTSLCRVLRGETLKLREVDFIQAARALGVGWFRIISRHVIPNVMHIVLIAIALDFSMLVLAEAVLTYVGVGVDPTTISWGNMIDSARLELAREPVVWWSLVAAFLFMFVFVLAANLFADALREAFDPRMAKR
ncbi:MAG: peptide ABC transporter permease [Legionellales bacterium]|nr:peptide ABC transporter permease [Legionellales bacterium]|tara:strand:+ start:1962 stop:3368 length:1407 start_codon:yes stop_codon:yes gene_type:complete